LGYGSIFVVAALPSAFIPRVRSGPLLCIVIFIARAAFAASAENEHAKALLERVVALGDWGGTRSAMEERGIAFGIHYTQEVLGVLSGGLSRGTEYNGLLELDLDLDLEKFVGWKGATIHAAGFAAAGESLSERHVGDEGNVSNINMRNDPRLFELWLEQQFGEAVSIRLGMLADDSQFADTAGASFESRGGGLFVHSDFGAMPLMSFNVPEPIWPVAAPGVCVTVAPTSALTLRAAVYDGQPIPADAADRRNLHGLDWRLSGNDGALVMIEATLAINSSAPTVGKSTPSGLRGIYKIGGFYHTGSFTRWSDGEPVHGDGGGYFSACQMVWRENDRDNQGLSLFARVGAAPRDRNELDFTLEAGLHYRGLLPGRDDDAAGIAVAVERYSRDFSSAERRAGNAGRDHESVIEIAYRAQLAPWLGVQPDLQYVVHPSGAHSIRNAVVAGLRVTMDF
jgi:porin